jgi:hypothetical protein
VLGYWNLGPITPALQLDGQAEADVSCFRVSSQWGMRRVSAILSFHASAIGIGPEDEEDEDARSTDRWTHGTRC